MPPQTRLPSWLAPFVARVAADTGAFGPRSIARQCAAGAASGGGGSGSGSAAASAEQGVALPNHVLVNEYFSGQGILVSGRAVRPFVLGRADSGELGCGERGGSQEGQTAVASCLCAGEGSYNRRCHVQTKSAVGIH
jgi:hypothetical protein